MSDADTTFNTSDDEKATMRKALDHAIRSLACCFTMLDDSRGKEWREEWIMPETLEMLVCISNGWPYDIWPEKVKQFFPRVDLGDRRATPRMLKREPSLGMILTR